MADSPKQRASSIAEEPQQDDALASDDDDGAPAAKPHPPVGGSPKPHPPVTGSPKRPGETPLRARSKTFGMSEEAFPPASGGPEPGRQSAADGRFFAPKTRRRDTVYASHVEVENSVEAFWRLCALHPRLIDEAEAAHEESLTAEEKDARAQRRRKRIRAKAEAAMAEFERLPEIERYDPQKQGDLDMYSEENLAIRERLRDDRRVCRMLERWWAGSSAHDDRDKNEALDHDEYERFYARLVHLVDPDDEMTELEIAEAMEDDFRSDSEGHAQVTKDEFVASVFELADNWTNSTDADEYVEFLKLGYDRVYGDLDDDDEVRFPDEWKPYLESGQTLTRMTLPQCTEFTLACIDAHSLARKNGSETSLAALCVNECRTRFNCKNERDVRKRVKALALALEHANCEDAHNDWLWLFSRMVGCYRISGRVKSIPPPGVDFVCKAFDEIEGMLKDSKRSLPSKLKCDEEKLAGTQSPRVGFIGVAPLKKWLAANVFRPLRISENDEPQLLHAILRVLEKMARSLESEARAQSITNADVNNFKVKDLVTCVEVMVLISNVWCAMHYDEFENRQKEKREQGREGGAALARVRRSRKKR